MSEPETRTAWKVTYKPDQPKTPSFGMRPKSQTRTVIAGEDVRSVIGELENRIEKDDESVIIEAVWKAEVPKALGGGP